MPVFVRYGLVGGVVLGALFFAPFAVFGMSPGWLRVSEVVGYSTMILCMTSTFLAMRSEQRRRGSLSFGSAFGLGVGVSLVAAVLFGLFTLVFYAVQGDTAGQVLFDHYLKQLAESGLPEAEIQAQVAELEAMRWMFFDARFQAAVMFATVFLIGAVESALGAFVVRARR